MALSEDIVQIEGELARIGVTPTELCREAGIAHSTFIRWREGKFEPTLRNWRAVESALLRLKARSEQADAASAPGEAA